MPVTVGRPVAYRSKCTVVMASIDLFDGRSGD